MMTISKSRPAALMAFVGALIFISCKPDKPAPVVAESKQVVSSDWLSAEQNNLSIWSKDLTLDGVETYSCVFSTPDITSELLQNSTVLVYGKFYGYNQTVWPDEKVGLFPLQIFHDQPGSSVDKWSAEVAAGKVTIRVFNSDKLFPGVIHPENLFRVVVIPKINAVVTGAKPEGNMMFGKYSEGEIRDLSYDQVCKEAGIAK